MGVLLMFPATALVLAVWVLLEHAWQESRARRIAHRPVTTAEHLVHDQYVVLADFYEPPSPIRGGGR